MTDVNKQREDILSALKNYVDLGLPIIPVCAHDHAGYTDKHKERCRQAGKIPMIKNWQTHENTTIEQVRSWVQQFKRINIGLPLGHASGYVGIDVDGVDGEDMLQEMSGGELPETWEYVTGAGRRLLYQIPVGMRTKKFVNTDETQAHTECSILAFGQQTVLPPSIHHTGRVYEWLEGHSPEDMDCEMAPKWLLDLVSVDVRRAPGGIGILDLTKPGAPEVPKVVKVNPLIVTAELITSEFVGFEEVELDLLPPDDSYIGKAGKAQSKEQKEDVVSQEELMQRISDGSRDVQMTRIIGSFCAKFRALGRDYIMLMAKNHNQMFCDPPLDAFAIEAKVNHFWEMEQVKSAQFKSAGSDGEKKRFAPSVIAQAVINILEEKGYCLKVDEDHPVIWMTQKTQGPWQPLDTRTGSFQVYLKEPLGDTALGGDPTWTTVKHYKDVANAVVMELRAAGRIWETRSNNMDTQTLDAFEFIPLAGGKLLNWRSGEVNAWDPETNLTYVLPVEYDPNAKAPSWQQRLKEWLPDGGSRDILQEFVGYSLIPYMGFEKALVIQGEGANGKSLFLETIQGLLGYKVVDSINMRTLFSRFGQADLLGKVLNIVNEAGSEYLRGAHADDFKNLVSGGRIKADVKNQAPLTFNNTAKFIFSSNHDIKAGDKSEGWLRRLLIVPFEQDFTKSTTPKFEIMSALRAEYAGIFNWALEGLRRLMEQQEFSSSVSAERKKVAYIRDNDISADFFFSCLEKFDLASVSEDGKPMRAGVPSALVNQLFSSWVEYRESTVQKKVDHITKYLEKKHGLTKQRTQHVLIVNRSMTECWIGLKLNIRDANFLEMLINEPIPKFPEMKTYAIERLAEIDEMIYTPPNRAASVTELPNTQAK